MWLFSYGSNHPTQLVQRIGSVGAMRAAHAPDYKRVFRGFSTNWGGGVASLVRADGRPAYGYVADVTEDQLKKMDKYEGVASGKYRRARIPVLVDEATRPVDAIAYLSNSSDFNPPSREYLEAVAKTIGAFWKISGPGAIKVE